MLPLRTKAWRSSWVRSRLLRCHNHPQGPRRGHQWVTRALRCGPLLAARSSQPMAQTVLARVRPPAHCAQARCGSCVAWASRRPRRRPHASRAQAMRRHAMDAARGSNTIRCPQVRAGEACVDRLHYE